MNQSIRRICLTATAACGLLLSSASAQTTATTDPVGAMTLTIPAGSVMVGSVFVNQPLYEGYASSFSESGETTTVGFENTPFTGIDLSSGEFPNYYLEVTSPSDVEGYSFDIASNTDSSITVYGLLSSDFSVSNNDSLVVREHVSLGQIFDDSGDDLVAGSDSVRFFQSDGSSVTFTYAGNGIWTSNFVSDQSDYPVYPGGGFITSFGNSVSTIVSGNVKMNATQVPLYSNAINLVSLGSPLNSTLGDSDLAQYLQLGSDSIRVMEKDGSFQQSGVYYAATTEIMTEDFATSANSTVIEGWLGFYVSVGQDRYVKIPAPSEL